MVTHKDLEKFGLSEKEGRVYLACLELGPSTVAQIAQKAGVNRATTYVAIEALTKLGLLSSHEKDHKTLFAAEDPTALKRLLEQQREEVKNKLSSLEDLLPELVKAHNYAGEKPRVRFFEGKEGLLTMQEDFLKTKDKKIEAVYNVDDYNKTFSAVEQEQYYETRTKKKIFARVLYNRDAGPFQEQIDKFIEMRFVAVRDFHFSSDISIYGNKIAVASLQGKLVGVIIENKQIADTLRSVFNLAWVAAARGGRK